MKYIILLLFVACNATAQFAYDPQRISSETLQIVHRLEKLDVLMGDQVGYSGMMPEQNFIYYELLDKAKHKEIIMLTNHPNPVVRCYALRSIKNKNKLFEIIKAHLKDEAIVWTQFGCVKEQEMAGDIFIRHGLYKDVFKGSVLDSLQIFKLDSLVIYSDSNLKYKNYAISRMTASLANYNKIRELLNNEHKQAAVLKLAEYKKESDVESIIRFHDSLEPDDLEGYYYFYKAVEVFPHPDFFPLLRQDLENVDKIEVSYDVAQHHFRAIGAYANQEAAVLLENLLLASDEERNEYTPINVSYAVEGHLVPAFDNILWKLIEDEEINDTEFFRYLYKRDAQRAYDFATKYWGLNTGAEAPELKDNEFVDVEILKELMLFLIYKQEPGQAINAIITAIYDEEKIRYTYNVMEQIKDKRLIEPLLNFLKQEEKHVNPIADVLLKYKDKALKKQVEEILQNKL